jgi:hypothetical protein
LITPVERIRKKTRDKFYDLSPIPKKCGGLPFFLSDARINLAEIADKGIVIVSVYSGQ